MMGEVIRVSGRAPDVGEFLREAMLSQRFADVALCCPGGQRFLAHRLVLSAASPYLQEVLLAHSKTSAHCEPITVILAEVEAPELAAILGFVYTGSATVPRPRLNAFLRAAEALHIRLPPVPVVMTCTEADLKQEDVKDVKINPKYLQCDQYPSCDRWFRHGRNNQENPANKKESYLGIESPFRDTRTYTESMNFVGYNPNRAYYPTTWSAPSFPSSYQEKGIQRINQSLEKERGNQIDARSYHPASMIPRIDRPNDLGDKSMESTLASSCDSSIKLYQQDFCLSKGPLDVHGRVDSLELRLRGDYSRVQTNYSSGKFVAEDEALERNLTTSENCLDGDRIREDRAGVIRSRESSFQSRTTSLQYTGRTRSYEKQDYGEDLTCGESCCRWRTPRRHVANRVTASPWRQIVRPHHSPKLQPIILQTHTDETEVGENVHVPETTRPAASSNSPNRQSPKNVSSTENFYGFEVPTACEMNPNSNTKSVECSSNTETRLQEFYPPPMAFLTQSKIPSTTGNVKCNETLFQSQNNLSTGTRLLPSNTNNVQVMSTNKKSNYFGQSIPQTSQKPELSHPISRLCDTIESDEKSDNFNTLEVKKLEEESRIDEKIVGRIFVNSDSNNNDAIVSTDATPRGRSIGGPEDHRCDQCGKTFVTRASLKVHSRTHSGEKPFRCADCGKQFSQLRNYKYHRSVHEGTREFAATCPECGKYFNDRGYLSSHMKIHRNRKEYGCAECGKSFNQRVAYNMHARIHTGVKPHQCEQCGKAFSRKMLLKQHLRTHSGERPYQCQVCQKAFADRSNMTLHTRLHSGLKPYQCTLCSKAFTKKHHLKTHLNYHTGTKPYSCPNCGLRFSQSSNMRTHFKKCAVNNPGGVKNSQNEGTLIESSKAGETQVIPRTPTDALTPPNSDQESSILTPIPKSTGTEGSMT